MFHFNMQFMACAHAMQVPKPWGVLGGWRGPHSDSHHHAHGRHVHARVQVGPVIPMLVLAACLALLRPVMHHLFWVIVHLSPNHATCLATGLWCACARPPACGHGPEQLAVGSWQQGCSLKQLRDF